MTGDLIRRTHTHTEEHTQTHEEGVYVNSEAEALSKHQKPEKLRKNSLQVLKKHSSAQYLILDFQPSELGCSRLLLFQSKQYVKVCGSYPRK